jgi:hypothetical protein
MGNYIDIDKVENELSAAKVRRIYDDDNDGEADVDPVEQLVTSAEQWFEAWALPIYSDLALLRTNGGAPAAFIVLEIARAMAATRFPRAFGQSSEKLWERANSLLDNLRKGVIKLPVQGSPNPPANTGGEYSETGLTNTGTCAHTFHGDGFGIF